MEIFPERNIVQTWTKHQVVEYLRTYLNGPSEDIFQPFIREDVDGSVLLELSMEDIEKEIGFDLGLLNFGHRKKFERMITHYSQGKGKQVHDEAHVVIRFPSKNVIQGAVKQQNEEGTSTSEGHKKTRFTSEGVPPVTYDRIFGRTPCQLQDSEKNQYGKPFLKKYFRHQWDIHCRNIKTIRKWFDEPLDARRELFFSSNLRKEKAVQEDLMNFFRDKSKDLAEYVFHFDDPTKNVTFRWKEDDIYQNWFINFKKSRKAKRLRMKSSNKARKTGNDTTELQVSELPAEKLSIIAHRTVMNFPEKNDVEANVEAIRNDLDSSEESESDDLDSSEESESDDLDSYEFDSDDLEFFEESESNDLDSYEFDSDDLEFFEESESDKEGHEFQRLKEKNVGDAWLDEDDDYEEEDEEENRVSDDNEDAMIIDEDEEEKREENIGVSDNNEAVDGFITDKGDAKNKVTTHFVDQNSAEKRVGKTANIPESTEVDCIAKRLRSRTPDVPKARHPKRKEIRGGSGGLRRSPRIAQQKQFANLL